MSECKTHWKKLTNPDYLGAYALDDEKDIVATIKTVGQEKVIGTDGKKEECTVAHFYEPDIKPMILNCTNCKTITKLYKTPFIEEWAGRKIQIGIESVKAFGDVVDALRVRALVPKVETPKQPEYYCTDCGQLIKAYSKDKPAAWMAQYTQDKYGKQLCSDCAKKAAEDKTKAETVAAEATAALDDAMKQEETVNNG